MRVYSVSFFGSGALVMREFLLFLFICDDCFLIGWLFYGMGAQNPLLVNLSNEHTFIVSQIKYTEIVSLISGHLKVFSFLCSCGI